MSNRIQKTITGADLRQCDLPVADLSVAVTEVPITFSGPFDPIVTNVRFRKIGDLIFVSLPLISTAGNNVVTSDITMQPIPEEFMPALSQATEITITVDGVNMQMRVFYSATSNVTIIRRLDGTIQTGNGIAMPSRVLTFDQDAPSSP